MEKYRVCNSGKIKKYPQDFDAENHIKTVDIVDN